MIPGIICLVVLVLSVLGISAHVAEARSPKLKAQNEQIRRRRRAKRARYCTKHVIVKPVPGGPERLVWVLGPHHTPGNACDGPEHKRSPAWW